MFEILKSAYNLHLALYIREDQARVTSPDGDTVLFKLLAGILQGDTLAPYLFIIVLDLKARTALDGKKDLGFMLEHKRSRMYTLLSRSLIWTICR